MHCHLNWHVALWNLELGNFERAKRVFEDHVRPGGSWGPPIIVSATLATGTAILFEAGLSFLGLTDPNVMSWGLMVGTGRAHLREAWWAVTFPGMCIFFTVLGICLVGDGLNDAFNPKLRQR